MRWRWMQSQRTGVVLAARLRVASRQGAEQRRVGWWFEPEENRETVCQGMSHG